jgi:hypothetical protein
VNLDGLLERSTDPHVDETVRTTGEALVSSIPGAARVGGKWSLVVVETLLVSSLLWVPEANVFATSTAQVLGAWGKTKLHIVDFVSRGVVLVDTLSRGDIKAEHIMVIMVVSNGNNAVVLGDGAGSDLSGTLWDFESLDLLAANRVPQEAGWATSVLTSQNH